MGKNQIKIWKKDKTQENSTNFNKQVKKTGKEWENKTKQSHKEQKEISLWIRICGFLTGSMI